MGTVMKSQAWYVYVLRCADDTFYTGITTDVARRLQEHNESKKGAKYTRVRRPLCLHYSEAQPDRALAAAREYRLRRLSHLAKAALQSVCKL